MELTLFELLSNEPIHVEGVGDIKIPTLRDIRKIGYNVYEMLCNYLSVDLKKYLEIQELKEQYDKLSEDGKLANTLYNLIIRNAEFSKVYVLIFSFFISENMKFNTKNESFEFYKTEDNGRELIGIINNDNFDIVRDYLLQINKIKQIEVKNEAVKYKNETARKLAERMEQAAKVKQDKELENFNIGKMISKYCADNKNGINILNIWDMSIYQFYDQFAQHNHIRESNIQDMVYANTVSFSDLNTYDSQLWLK